MEELEETFDARISRAAFELSRPSLPILGSLPSPDLQINRPSLPSIGELRVSHDVSPISSPRSCLKRRSSQLCAASGTSEIPTSPLSMASATGAQPTGLKAFVKDFLGRLRRTRSLPNMQRRQSSASDASELSASGSCHGYISRRVSFSEYTTTTVTFSSSEYDRRSALHSYASLRSSSSPQLSSERQLNSPVQIASAQTISKLRTDLVNGTFATNHAPRRSELSPRKELNISMSLPIREINLSAGLTKEAISTKSLSPRTEITSPLTTPRKEAINMKHLAKMELKREFSQAPAPIKRRLSATRYDLKPT
eukprot:Colp12_sorted_trinity150504_noHs@9858